MHIITRRHLVEAGQGNAELANDLESWYRIAKSAQWYNFVEVRQSFPSADCVDDYVFFNIRHNRYRLVAIIHYSREAEEGRIAEGRVFIRAVLTHKEYDDTKNWDKGVPL
jgi:mRNA interferase HigB